MKLLDDYKKLQEQILVYFGFDEGWTVYPIEDCREFYWFVTGDEVYFAKTIEELESGEGNSFVYEINRHSGYPKHVYRADGYTMIMTNTNADFNQFLSIFDNAKEQK